MFKNWKKISPSDIVSSNRFFVKLNKAQSVLLIFNTPQQCFSTLTLLCILLSSLGSPKSQRGLNSHSTLPLPLSRMCYPTPISPPLSGGSASFYPSDNYKLIFLVGFRHRLFRKASHVFPLSWAKAFKWTRLFFECAKPFG